MRQIVDTEDPDEFSSLGPDELTPDNNTELVFPKGDSPASEEDFHPDPVHAFRLWQIFLDRVNPLTKIIHVPTLQPYVVEASTNISNIPLQYQALLFSIYLMGTIALSEAETVQLLGMPRDVALRRFTAATKQALQRYDFLRNYDMAALQALLLFLVRLSIDTLCDFTTHWAPVLAFLLLTIAIG